MRVLDRSTSDQWLVACAGAVLLILSLAGVAYGVRTCAAMLAYHQAKYGVAAGNTARVLSLCRRAYGWYPWNYRFSIVAAEQAYHEAGLATGKAREEFLRQAQFWCERGLRQNWRKSQLRRLKTRFLLEESPVKAAQFWAEFTDWQFWEPYNHAVLAELYARSGDFDKAEQSLKWAEGSSSYDAARAVVLEQQRSWAEALEGENE